MLMSVDVTALLYHVLLFPLQGLEREHSAPRELSCGTIGVCFYRLQQHDVLSSFKVIISTTPLLFRLSQLSFSTYFPYLNCLGIGIGQ